MPKSPRNVAVLVICWGRKGGEQVPFPKKAFPISKQKKKAIADMAGSKNGFGVTKRRKVVKILLSLGDVWCKVITQTSVR